ncbi:acyltransferase domain-containing protein, partial [Streptomyces coffeae]
VELLDSSPVFAEHMAACAHALEPFVDWSLDQVLRATEDAPSLDRVDVVQPALWAVMVSLAGLWRSLGVEPSAVIGHSQGEIAAACVAGGLSLEDGARIVALRSRLVRERLAGHGGMMSIAAPVEHVEKLLTPHQGRISIAAVNGPTAIVVAGEPAALDALATRCESEDIRTRRIAVDYASHSAQVETIKTELHQILAPITPRSGQIRFYSTTENRYLDTASLDAAYWYDNLRGRVGFEPAVRALTDNGAGCFLEMSPHPVLTMAVEDTTQGRAAVVGSLRRDDGGPQRFITSLAEAHTAGVTINWPALYTGTGAHHIPLPTYPFQHQHYWVTPGTRTGDMTTVGQVPVDHPVLAAAVPVGDRDEWIFTGR